MARRRAFNPCYFALVVLGVAFTITVCAYIVLTFQDSRAAFATDDAAAGGSPLDLLRAHGGKILAGELALLAVATALTIGLDGRPGRDTAARPDSASQSDERGG